MIRDRAEGTLSEQQELTERLLLLRQLPVLRQLDALTLMPIAASIVPERFDAGEVICEEADPPRAFYLIREGTVRCSRHGLHFGVMRGPNSIGLLPMLARTAGSFQIVAETRVSIYRVDDEVVRDVFEDHFTVLLTLVRSLAQALLHELDVVAGPPLLRPLLEPLIPPSAPELTLVEKIAALRRMGPFAGANVASLARFALGLEELHLAAGTELWARGDASDYALIILFGEAEQRWDDKRRTVTPGFILGGAETIGGVPRVTSARTTAPTVALRSSRANFTSAMEDNLDLGLHFVSFLAGAILGHWDVRAAAGEEPLTGFVVPGAGAPQSTAPTIRFAGRTPRR
jgi:hypothetical protein